MEEIKSGTIVTINKAGKLEAYTLYTRLERAVRRAGAFFHIKRLSRYHERIPVGIVFSGRIAVYGVVQLDGEMITKETIIEGVPKVIETRHQP